MQRVHRSGLFLLTQSFSPLNCRLRERFVWRLECAALRTRRVMLFLGMGTEYQCRFNRITDCIHRSGILPNPRGTAACLGQIACRSRFISRHLRVNLAVESPSIKTQDLRTSYCSCLIHQAYRGMGSIDTHRRWGILPRIGTETSNYKTSAFNRVSPKT